MYKETHGPNWTTNDEKLSRAVRIFNKQELVAIKQNSEIKPYLAQLKFETIRKIQIYDVPCTPKWLK